MVVEEVCFVNVLEGESKLWTAVGEVKESGITATGPSASAALRNWRREAKRTIAAAPREDCKEP